MRPIRTPLLALTAALMVAASGNAQIEMRGGWSYSMPSVQVDDVDVDNVQDRSGFHLGVLVDRGGLLGYRAGIFYTQKGFDSDSAVADLNYIEVPAMLRVNTPLFRVYGGVNVAFEIDCNVEGVPTPGGLRFFCENQTEALDFGFRLGAGTKLLQFSLDLAYVWSVTDVWLTDRGSIKHRVLQVDLGLRI